MSKTERKMTLFLIPVCLVLILLTIKTKETGFYDLIIEEDEAVEYLQSALFFSASLLAFFTSRAFYRQKHHILVILYGLLCLGLFFIAGEEISWGQRILGIETTGFFLEKNLQKETTVHNLIPFQHHLNKLYIFIGCYGTFGWLFFKKFKRKQLHFIYPGWYLSSYFLFTLLIYSYFEFIGPFAVNTLGIDSMMIGRFFVWRDQEPAELILSLGFFIFTAIQYFRIQGDFNANSQKKSANIFKRIEQESIKIQRNAPCPCGSGKKYKKCCLI